MSQNNFSISLQTLAKKLNLSFCGNGNLEIHAIADLQSVTESYASGNIYFYEKPPIQKKQNLETCAFLVTDDKNYDKEISALLSSPETLRENFAKLLDIFAPPIEEDFLPNTDFSYAHVDKRAEVSKEANIFPGANILAYAKVAAGCKIYPNATIGQHAEIGEDTTLYANASVYAYCKIGKHCILHSGSVVGADGFGFHDMSNGKRIKIPQIGNVVLKDFVELGASSTIDRATIGSTVVGEQTKIDNLVQVGHNCQLGRYIYLAGHVGIAGSCVLEDGVVLAGNVGVKDHVRIEKGIVVLAMSGVAGDLLNSAGHKAYFGVPARPAREMHRINHSLTSLPKLVRKSSKIFDDEKETESN